MNTMKQHNKTSLAVALSVALSAPALAQTQQPDAENIEKIEIVGQVSKFSALKSDTPIMETARSVSVESIDQYLLKGALTLDDTLVYSAGVLGETFGFSTRGDFANVRGFDAPEYRDGMQSLSGNYNNTRPEIYTLEQVEVLKGPASVLFGPGSPGGIINIISKRPNAEHQDEVMFELGSYDRKQIAADFGFNSEDEQVLTRFVGLVRDSDTQIEQINDDSVVFAPSVTFHLSDTTEVTLLGDYTKRESDTAHQFLPHTGTLNPGTGGAVTDPTVYVGEPGFNQFDTESWAITLLAEHRFNETWSFDMSSRYRDGESSYRQAWISFAGNGVPRVDANGNGPRSWYAANGFSKQFQFDLRARAEFDTGDAAHRVLIGASHQRIDNRNDTAFLYGVDFSTGAPVVQGGIINVFNPQYGFTPELPAIATGLDTEDNILGVYVHDEISIGDWIFNAGVRFDDVEQKNALATNDESETSISVSALYQFDSGLSPYINYAESFQPVYGVDQITQQALKPQQGEQIEAGIKYQPRGTKHAITAAYFDIELSNLGNPNSLPNASSQQEGISTVQGFELEASLQFDQISAEANLTTLDSEDPDGFQRSSTPESMASIWLQYTPELLDGFTSGFGVRYTGKSESTGISVLTGQPLTIDTPSYTVVDAMIGYQWSDWSISLNVRNAADKEYYSTCLVRGDCFPGEKRSITARATYNF